MPSEARLKKNTEQLKEGLKSSILGPQNLGSGGGARAPRAPPGSASASCSINQFYGLFHFFCSNGNCIVSFIYYILTFPQNSFCNFLPVFRKTRLIFFILSIHILPKVFVLNVSCLLPAHIRILINLPSNLIEQLFES